MRIDEAAAEFNRGSWKSTAASAGDHLRSYGLGATLDDDLATFKTLTNAAWALVRYAFDMIAGEGDEALIREALDRAVRAAEEALRRESSDQLFYPVDPVAQRAIMPGEPIPENAIMPTPKMKRIEKLQGKMESLEYLSSALWFRDGTRPMDIFKESVELRKERYKLQAFEFEELVLNCVQAEDYEYASAMCGKKLPKAVLPPKGGQFKRSDCYVLYVLSQYALGNRELEPYAREGVSYRYEDCRIWDTEHPGWSPWWRRLGWAYLWGKHFSGVTDGRQVIHGLRGY